MVSKLETVIAALDAIIPSSYYPLDHPAIERELTTTVTPESLLIEKERRETRAMRSLRMAFRNKEALFWSNGKVRIPILRAILREQGFSRREIEEMIRRV